ASNTIDQKLSRRGRQPLRAVMPNRFLALTLAFAFLPGAGSLAQEANPPIAQQPPAGNQQRTPETGQEKVPVFRKTVNLVNVQFTVKDKHGVMVPNLNKDRFDLLEDGRPQTIKYFAPQTDLPLTLGLLIDTSKSMEHTLPQEKIVAGGFLQKVL